MLDTQISILSVDTGNFYSQKEAQLHWKNHKLRKERNKLKEIIQYKEKDLKNFGLNDKKLKLIQNIDYEYLKDNNLLDFVTDENNKNIIYDNIKEYRHYYFLFNYKKEKIKQTKNELLSLLERKVNDNIKSNGKHHIRKLNENKVSEKNIISVFDSSLTRMIGAKKDEFTEDFMVVQVYYFDVIRDVIYYGFEYKGEKYIYFTSSAGQIRTKKCVFIKESIYKKYEKTLMCGLTVDKINEKGGNNPNKHLAYLALTNSATDVWEEFDIDKSIVIDDFETEIIGTYDYIDDKDYTITRKTDKVLIPHTDGAGMMLPKMGKNRMVRLPWVKGLLGVFDFRKFIEVNNCSPIIKDIYGKEHNVTKEDIQVIFTKSQFKMWKYYDSWEQYKEYFKKYKCSAGQTNVEEDRIKNATINYQMLQSLIDITDDEISKIINKSTNKLSTICDSVESLKNIFGINPYNQNQTYLQKSVDLYPDLMNDEFFKDSVRKIKDNLVKRYKSGGLEVNGKYTFLLPDFYAACEYWFKNIKQPKGLLENGEVFCWLFRNDKKLDCLRSPHLYMEHAIRNNIAYNGNDRQKKLREWFTTDAIYTSTHDMISKVLMFDVDGDKSLVVSDKTLIKVAERNIKKYDVVPLFYDMKKAHPVILTNKSIYEGLKNAFVGGNIGIYSNNISKIWNSDVFLTGTDDEKKKALDIIKLLVAENNFTIDYAKTLYKPERPYNIKEQIKEFTNMNLPHYFIYAKDKCDWQVENKNNSFVNKIDNLIINPRINTRGIGFKKIDYTFLVNNPDIDCKVGYLKNGHIDKDKTDPMIVRYMELNQEYHFKINMEQADIPRDLLTYSQIKQDMFLKRISEDVRTELLSFGYSEDEISDILVKFLYYIKPSKHKALLWFCYGEYIYNNLCKYFSSKYKTVQCKDCGKWFNSIIIGRTVCRCDECRDKYNKIYKKEFNNKYYKKHKQDENKSIRI